MSISPSLEKALKDIYEVLPNETALNTFHEYLLDAVQDMYHDRLEAIVKKG